MRLLAQGGVEGSSPLLNISIFAIFVIITLAIVIRVSKKESSGASDLPTRCRATTSICCSLPIL